MPYPGSVPCQNRNGSGPRGSFQVVSLRGHFPHTLSAARHRSPKQKRLGLGHGTQYSRGLYIYIYIYQKLQEHIYTHMKCPEVRDIFGVPLFMKTAIYRPFQISWKKTCKLSDGIPRVRDVLLSRSVISREKALLLVYVLLQAW